MSDKQLDNRVRRLQTIEAQQQELEAQAESIRAEIKAALEAKGEDERNTAASSSAGGRSSAAAWTARRSSPRCRMYSPPTAA